MRNGDFIPTRLHSQNDAVNMMARFKTKDNVETHVGLLTFSEYVTKFNGHFIIKINDVFSALRSVFH